MTGGRGLAPSPDSSRFESRENWTSTLLSRPDEPIRECISPRIDARLPETWTLGQACSRRPSCTLAIIPSDKYLWAILLEIGRWIFDGVHRYLQIFSCPLCTGQLQIRGKADRGLSRLWRDWFNVYIYWISRRRISIENYAREIVG